MGRFRVDWDSAWPQFVVMCFIEEFALTVGWRAFVYSRSCVIVALRILKLPSLMLTENTRPK